MKSISFFVALFVFLLAGCDFLSESSDVSEQNKAIKTANGIQYTLSIPTNTYSLEDTLEILFQARNHSIVGRELRFTNLPELCYQLQNKFDNFTIYYPNLTMPAGITHFLKPNEIKSFNAVNLFKDHNGNFINKGEYILTAFLGNSNSPKLKLLIKVN